MSDYPAIPSADFIARLTALEREMQEARSARHQVNAHLSNIVDEERGARMEMEVSLKETQRTVAQLAESVKEVCAALKGSSFGQTGIVAQIGEMQGSLKAHCEEAARWRASLDARINEGRGMLRLLAWTGAVLGVIATVRGFVN